MTGVRHSAATLLFFLITLGGCGGDSEGTGGQTGEEAAAVQNPAIVGPVGDSVVPIFQLTRLSSRSDVGYDVCSAAQRFDTPAGVRYLRMEMGVRPAPDSAFFVEAVVSQDSLGAYYELVDTVFVRMSGEGESRPYALLNASGIRLNWKAASPPSEAAAWAGGPALDTLRVQHPC